MQLRMSVAIRYVLLTFDINHFMTTMTKMKNYPINNNKKGHTQRPIYLIHSTRSILTRQHFSRITPIQKATGTFHSNEILSEYFILVWEHTNLIKFMSLNPTSHVFDPNKEYIAF